MFEVVFYITCDITYITCCLWKQIDECYYKLHVNQTEV